LAGGAVLLAVNHGSIAESSGGDVGDGVMMMVLVGNSSYISFCH